MNRTNDEERQKVAAPAMKIAELAPVTIGRGVLTGIGIAVGFAIVRELGKRRK